MKKEEILKIENKKGHQEREYCKKRKKGRKEGRIDFEGKKSRESNESKLRKKIKKKKRPAKIRLAKYYKNILIKKN